MALVVVADITLIVLQRIILALLQRSLSFLLQVRSDGFLRAEKEKVSVERGRVFDKE